MTFLADPIVGRLAEDFAAPFGAEEWGRLAGIGLPLGGSSTRICALSRGRAGQAPR